MSTRIKYAFLALIPVSIVVYISISGCNPKHEEYEPDLRYEIRKDPIVESVPAQQPGQPATVGKMDQYIRNLPTLGGKIIDPANLPEDKRTTLNTTLEELFGSPSKPKVETISSEVQSKLGLEPDTLAEGSASYRARCVQCHGISGDGRGPTGPWVYPYPRDYRSGIFKYSTSARANGKPRTEDMALVIRRGAQTTSMPQHDRLNDTEIRQLVGYVIHLSIRGELERRLIKGLLADDESAIDDIATSAKPMLTKIVFEWMESQQTQSRIPTFPVLESKAEEYQASIRRGHELFKSTGCMSCHESYGKKDVYRFDAWGLPNKVQDLTQPERKWGKSREEIARRAMHGILPANMPATMLKDDQVIDLTHFLLELPTPMRLPVEVRNEVDRARP